jgi:hypothetical protein
LHDLNKRYDFSPYGTVRWRIFRSYTLSSNATSIKAGRLTVHLNDEDANVATRRESLTQIITNRKAISALVTLHPLVLEKMNVPFYKKARIEALIAQRKVIIEQKRTAHLPRSIAQEMARWASN